MLAKSLVQTSMAVLVWKTICTPSSSCFPPTHFHLLSSFSHLILLCLHVKNKGFHITNLGSPILPKKQKALWSHTFPTLSAYSTHSDVKGDQELLVASSELNSFLFSISHAQSTESLPKVSIDLFTMVPHNWYRVSFPKLPSASQTIFLSLSPYVHTYLSHPLRTPLSLSLSPPSPTIPEEKEQPYQPSSFMTLHPFSGHFSNILKHLYVVIFQVSQLHTCPN